MRIERIRIGGFGPLEDVDLSAVALDLAEFYQPVAEPGQLSVAVEPGLVVRGHRRPGDRPATR